MYSATRMSQSSASLPAWFSPVAFELGCDSRTRVEEVQEHPGFRKRSIQATELPPVRGRDENASSGDGKPRVDRQRGGGTAAGRGYEVAGFDIADGADVLDAASLPPRRRAVGRSSMPRRPCAQRRSGCEFHHPERHGNWNALAAAQQVGARRVVTFSSVNASAFSAAKPGPIIFRSTTIIRSGRHAYGIAKRLVENCAGASRDHRDHDDCLRPPRCSTARHARFAARCRRSGAEWTVLEYGAFIDVRDVAFAGSPACRCRIPAT